MGENIKQPIDKDGNIAAKILGGIGTVIVAVVVYAIWVNSHAFEDSFFGMTFQMPLESRQHYCNRKADKVLTFDTAEYNSCLKEISTKGTSASERRHNSLVTYLMNTFKDDSTNQVDITISQAECMAKKVEAKLTDSQIDDFVKGKSIGDQLGTTAAIQILNDMISCVK